MRLVSNSCMKLSSKILIVTPTLGTRQTLLETCKSVRDIGGDKVEHIVACPGKAINAVMGMVNGAEVVEEGKGKGVYAPVNHVLKMKAPHHEWVGYINDDDYWLPDMKRLIDSVSENSTSDVFYGRVLYINEQGDPLIVGSSSNRFESVPILAARGIFAIPQPATLIRSDLYLRLGGFDETLRLLADTDFWIRAIMGGAHCRFIDKVCATYRLQPGQLSGDTKAFKLETDRMLAQHGLRGDNWRGRIEEGRYRLENAKVYFTRLWQTKGGLRSRDLMGHQ